MSDDPHDELDFDPLDDTKRWPEDQFPLLPVGRLVLDRNPSNVFAETEQAAFGTGVLVDGIDFRSEEHTSELQTLMRISYCVFCLKKQKANATSPRAKLQTH